MGQCGRNGYVSGVEKLRTDCVRLPEEVSEFQKRRVRMTDLMGAMKKTMMTGIGLALRTKDEVEVWARDLVTRGEVSENEGEKFVDELLKRYDEARENLESRIEKITQEFITKAKVASNDDVDELRKEIEELKKEVARLSK